jgi:hypothetical protein
MITHRIRRGSGVFRLDLCQDLPTRVTPVFAFSPGLIPHLRIDGHHLMHWAHSGPTDLGNLVNR